MPEQTVWDPLRRKDVALTPEEEVRQWFITVLRDGMKIPEHMMMSEVSLKVGAKPYRADIVVYDRTAKPLMVVECKRPDIVRKLVLCSTSAYANETSRAILDTWVKLAEEKAAEELVLSFAEKVYSREYSEKYRSAFIEFSRSITEEELDNFIIMVKGTYGFDVRDNIGCIKAPVLVMGADQDMIFTDAPSKEIAQLTGGELYIYSKEAHGVYDEVPDVIARIKAFSDK